MKKVFFALACLASFSAAEAAAPKVSAAALAGVVHAADSVDLKEYAGKYKFEGLPFEYITVAVKDGKLTINTGTDEGALTPLKDADSFDASGQATFRFTRNAEKKITGVTLEAQGNYFDGKKES
jgi:Domain of unknown function (DUF3471)